MKRIALFKILRLIFVLIKKGVTLISLIDGVYTIAEIQREV